MKRVLASILAVSLVLSLLCGSAFADTFLYIGSDLTEDNVTFFARSEDYSNSYNKLFYVSPAAKHVADEKYSGCYGFSYTFTHDSYSYTAFSDDNGSAVGGVCPNCGDTHAHTPYESAGTNEMGVSVSASEVLCSDDAIRAADPFVENGIGESEIPTIILSEADSARAGVDLLLSIYDTAGCNNAFSILIADANEIWYIENMTGHQYIALKLSDSMAMVQPDMSVIGLIDLDDTDNVIASKDVITVAQNAKCFVGNVERNTIDYRASYAADQISNVRMNSGLSYLTGKEDRTFTASDYAISNVDTNNNIVPMYTNIVLDDSLTIEDVIAFYHIDNIGSTRSLETHIFEITDEPSVMSTIEWVAMDDAAYNVFIPYYPMLTTDVYAGYTVSTTRADFVSEITDVSKPFYPTTMTKIIDDERVSEEGFCVLPEDWETSLYWSLDALSNLLYYGGYNKATVQYVENTLYDLQKEFITQFTALQPAIINSEDAEIAKELATQFSIDLATKLHVYVLEMVNALLGGDFISIDGSGSGSGSGDSISTNGIFNDEELEQVRNIATQISDFIIGIVGDDEYNSGETASAISDSVIDTVLRIYKQNRDNGNFDADNYSSSDYSLDDLEDFLQ